mgnify:CR=1 FL=1
MPDCFVRSGILELMVMVVNLVFDNHPFTYACLLYTSDAADE